MKLDCLDCGRNSGDKDEGAHQSRSTHWSPRVAPARNDMLTRFVQSHTGFLRSEDHCGIPCTNCATSIISNMPKPKERNLWTSFSQPFHSLSYFHCLSLSLMPAFPPAVFCLQKQREALSIIFEMGWSGKGSDWMKVQHLPMKWCQFFAKFDCSDAPLL